MHSVTVHLKAAADGRRQCPHFSCGEVCGALLFLLNGGSAGCEQRLRQRDASLD